MGDIDLLGFSVRTEMDVFFVGESKSTLFLYDGRKLLDFGVSMGIDLVCVMVAIDLISVWGIALDLISVQE